MIENTEVPYIISELPYHIIDSISKSKNMIRLCLDGEEYLSHQSDKPITSGSIYGGYFGSSTRIPGGEIWHPKTGYNKIRISLEIMEIGQTEWRVIINKEVDFAEEFVKLESNNDFDMKIEKFIAIDQEREPNFEQIIQEKQQLIEQIRMGKICNVGMNSKISLSNDSCDLTLTLRDLHRFEGEIQISGCSYTLK